MAAQGVTLVNDPLLKDRFHVIARQRPAEFAEDDFGPVKVKQPYPYISIITGTDPTYRYKRQFVGRMINDFTRDAEFSYKMLERPLLLDCRGITRGVFCLFLDQKVVSVVGGSAVPADLVETLFWAYTPRLIEIQEFTLRELLAAFIDGGSVIVPALQSMIQARPAVRRYLPNAAGEIARVRPSLRADGYKPNSDHAVNCGVWISKPCTCTRTGPDGALTTVVTTRKLEM